MDKYYLIYFYEGGEISIRKFSKARLIEELDFESEGTEGVSFWCEQRADGRIFHPEGRYMVIKGDIISPKPKQIIETWDIE